jgi:lysophospholipase L1-like esterase
MALGDSITKGHASYDTWGYWLSNDLDLAGYSVDFVGSQSSVQSGVPLNPQFDQDHEGYWGWTSGQILAQTLGWAQAAQPDLVLLHLGTNDLAAFVPVSQIIANLTQIITDLRTVNPSVTVLLAQIIPTSQVFAGPQIPGFNAQVVSLGLSLDTPASRVIGVDQFTGFSVANDTWDGIHPNESGGLRIADRWLPVIADQIPGVHLLASNLRGPGSLYVRNLGGPPNHVYFTAISLDPANAGAGLGTGWFGGLHIAPQDVFTQYQIQAAPFVGLLDGRGSSVVVYPIGTFAGPPLDFYAITVALDPSNGNITEVSAPRVFHVQ